GVPRGRRGGGAQLAPGRALRFRRGLPGRSPLGLAPGERRLPEGPAPRAGDLRLSPGVRAGEREERGRGMHGGRPGSARLGREAGAGSPFDLACAASGLAVTLSWTDGAAYDSVRVERDGATVATLPGDAHELADTVPGPGTYAYRVFGVVSGQDTLPAACRV